MSDPVPTGEVLGEGVIDPPAAHRPRVHSLFGVMIGPRVRVSASLRFAWGMVSLVCAAALGAAVYLVPHPAGYGTHEGLGMPPCGFMLRTGLPCPTCGMTTAFSQFVRGHWLLAFVAQPAGLVFAALSVVGMAGGAVIAIGGSTMFVDWDRIAVRLMLGLGLLILAGWGFKLSYGLITGSLPMRG